LPEAAELDRLRVVLVRTRNPLNIGAAARAMSNFGFTRLRVVNPYEASFREAQSAVGAAELLRSAEEFSSVSDAIADCSLVVGTTAVGHREIVHPLLRLEQGGRRMREHLGSGRAALLFGSENHGLSREDLSHCHWLLRIPTRAEHISMNLGQAVAVCLYELVREDSAARESVAETTERASGEDLERVDHALFEALAASDYIKAGADASTSEKARRLVRRMQLTPEDARTWTGMLAKMSARMRSGR
jgi:TrmH family RNA methyltransferase